MIADMVKQAICRDMEIKVATDCETLFNIVAQEGTATERRVQIEILVLKEAYRRGEVRNIMRIEGTSNPADALTKIELGHASPLCSLMQTNKFIPADLGGVKVALHEKEDDRV